MGTLKRLSLIKDIIAKENTKSKNPNSRILFIEHPKPQYLEEITGSSITYTSNFKNRIDLALEFNVTLDESEIKLFDCVVVTVSKSREESKILISTGFSKVKPPGLLIIEGEKKDGIDGTLKITNKKIPISSIESASHGKFGLFRVELKQKRIFDDWFELKKPKINANKFFTVPGLFSHKKVDRGSLFLANNFKNKLSGDVVDLGAGWGVLSKYALETNSAIKSITLIENNKIALDMAKLNVKGLKTRFLWSDLVLGTQIWKNFDVAICNPPFHNGSKLDFELSFSFVRMASRLLKRNGVLWLVANIQLPYEFYIKKCFFDIKILKDDGAFKIILAKNPKFDKLTR